MYLHFPQGMFSPPQNERGLEMIGFDFSFLKIASRSLMCSSGVQPYDYLQVMESEDAFVKYISDKDGPATYHFTIFGISTDMYGQ